MSESTIRERWRTRIRVMVDEARSDSLGEFDLGGWLDDLMQTPELSLAELAESNPTYRLAVVEFTAESFAMADGHARYNVVKVEER